MKVYQALYNHMSYESSSETLSLHMTKDGAERAIKKHRNEDQLEHLENYTPEMLEKEYEMVGKYGTSRDTIYQNHMAEKADWPKEWQWWGVKEIEVEK